MTPPGVRPAGVTGPSGGGPMKNQNAILLFARSPEITRSAGGGPFAALPWEDLDAVFHSCVGDLLQVAATVPDTDILLYRSARFPAEKLLLTAGNGTRQFDMPSEDFGECVQQAIESAFIEYYHRVIVVVENNPLLGRGLLRRATDQLGVEDDCAVITPSDDERLVLVALKANYPSLFFGKGVSVLARPSGVLARLCELDVMVFPTQPSFMIDSTNNIDRLRGAVASMDPGTPDYPKRTSAVFRTLEKKYRWRRPNA